MKRYVLITSVTFLTVFNSLLRADEGMWLLPLLEKLNYSTMKEMGLGLTPEQIYSINNASLKDAVVIFGSGCTGEIISDQGLILTNHHCGLDYIQNHSLGELDILQDGYWAKSYHEELPNPGLTVTFLISIEEVTDSIEAYIHDDMTEIERLRKIAEISQRLENQKAGGKNYNAEVTSFFDENRFFLFVYEVYKDVRLVGAPPESIGNFGDETDNWMWPRHTGDFSLFRVYADKEGRPADYSPDNIPLKPKYHLPINVSGVEKGDFTMILGYPGGTDRYISSWGVEELLEVTHPNRIKMRGVRQDILMEDMLADKVVFNKYATKYSRSSNYWKFSIGQSQGIKDLNVIERKKEYEARFTTWISEDEKREEVYGTVLNDLESYYRYSRDANSNLQLLSELLRGCELIDFSGLFMQAGRDLFSSEVSSDRKKEILKILQEDSEGFFAEYNLPTDIKVTKALIKQYQQMVKKDQLPDIYRIIEKKYKGDIDKYVDELFQRSIFADREKLADFLSLPNQKILAKDPALLIARSIQDKRIEESIKLQTETIPFLRARRLFTKGMLEMDSDNTLYPDANFTMRLTYGTVGGYSPADAVHYSYYTTLKGVMEKEDPDNYEFIVPEKLKELYRNQDYGPYGTKDYMPVCFTSNNDITGGNSGSPVLNGKGELIGLAFDGNWEAMSGDIVFENHIQKTINVDIRYVLFVIDKFGEAVNLIEEMTIVN